MKSEQKNLILRPMDVKWGSADEGEEYNYFTHYK